MTHRALALVLVLALLVGARADKQEYVRVYKDPRALQTAVTHYVTPAGVRIDLVGVVHMAEWEYYEELDARLQKYDAVLFEGIVDTSEDEPPKPAEKLSPTNSKATKPTPTKADVPPKADTPAKTSHLQLLTRTQQKICDLLGLTFQLEQIDYLAPNMVHADLTDAEIGKWMKKRGETGGDIFLKMMKASLKTAVPLDIRTSTALNVWLVTGHIDPEDQLRVRRFMAYNLIRMEKEMAEVGGTALVTARDEKVMQVLRQQLKKGKKRVAIFYGCAHMKDFDRRLRSQLKCKQTGQEWLTAWTL